MHKIILRDDDTNYFTKVEHLERLLALTPPNATMVLGAIPWLRPSVCGCVPSYYWPEVASIFDISDNPALVEFLRGMIAKSKVAIALHGIEHHYYSVSGKFVPEFYYQRYCKDQVLRAKGHLENTLQCTVNFFIPPSNKINLHNYAVISEIFPYVFNVPSRASISRPFRLMHLRRWSNRVLSGDNLASQGIFKPDNRIAEIPSIDLRINSLADVEQVGDFLNPSTFGLASHYWEIISDHDSEREMLYQNKLSQLASLGAKFWSQEEKL
jgi:hypothetical protein